MTESVMGTCPVCSGTGRQPVTDIQTRSYGIKYGYWGYRASDDSVDCRNCGAQYQFGGFGHANVGRVRLRRDNGEPCVHQYQGQQLGRCYWGYTCIYCGDYHTIDSGD